MYTKIFFALLALLIVLPSALFAAEWVEQDEGTIQGYRGITHSNDHLIAVGNSGSIVYSEDLGETWIESDGITSVWWLDVTTDADGNAVVVGESGVYAISEDGGVTWTSSSLSSTARFLDIDRSENYGYIVGVDGTILYFSESSNRWFTTTAVVAEDLNAVQDMGDGTAWTVGEFGRLLFLSNSGMSSSDIGRMASETLHGVHFVSDQVGWIVGEKGTIRKTETGATGWFDVEVEGVDQQNLYDIQVEGEQMLIVGDKVIITSEDAGVTWSVEDFSEENITFYAAYNGGVDALWAAGTNYDVWSSIYHYVPDVVVVEEEVVEETVEEEEEVVAVEPEAVDYESLIKIACEEGSEVNDPCRAVYFFSSDGSRHAFTNERVFFTWFDHFDDVVEVSSETMASIPFGSNVTYRPGEKMVKFQSVDTVYAVEQGGVLRAIASEEVAEALYGEDWNQQIDDIEDGFFGNYSFGDAIESAEDYDVDGIYAGTASLDENF
jgi:photosystem II stability/assembly factor-like uncharacterized protein